MQIATASARARDNELARLREMKCETRFLEFLLDTWDAGFRQKKDISANLIHRARARDLWGQRSRARGHRDDLAEVPGSILCAGAMLGTVHWARELGQ
jgi:hypothetical protein